MTDFKVAEAVFVKVKHEESDAHKKQMREDWKNRTDDLRTRIETSGGSVADVEAVA